MKLQFIKSFAILALMSGFITGCANDDHYSAEESECVDPGLAANKTVAEIVAMATSTPTKFVSTTPVIIEGYVTSSDERSNFFKIVSLQTMPTDGSAPIGFSVAIDDTSLYTKGIYPGRKLYIQLNDLYYAMVDGSLKIGGLFIDDDGNEEVGRIPQYIYESKVFPSCQEVSEDQLVRTMTISQAESNASLNTLVEIDNIQFTQTEVGLPYYDEHNDLGGATNRNLVDLFGGSVVFRVSSFSYFSGDLITPKSGKVRGVMTKFGSTFQFIPRYKEDIMLTEDRMAPLVAVYEEPFTSNFPTLWGKISVSGAQTWTLDTTHGNPGSCAKMSGFSGGPVVNEDWLISPAYDLSSLNTVVVTYDTATKFAGNPLEAYISTDYSGSGSPAAATWTLLNGGVAPTDSNYTWTASGPVDISSYAGQTVYIGFKYTSTSAAAATWEVDNVRIIGN